jgi:beta-N-acetylhexosaminidase
MGGKVLAKNRESLKSRAAGLFLVGVPGTAIDPELSELLRLGVRGVVLFKRNFEQSLDILDLNRSLFETAGRPLVISIDQEGGRVRRLGRPFICLPPMRLLGRQGTESLCRQLGYQVGRELRACAVMLNFAPVLDLDTNPANPVIGDRSFGAEPGPVSRLGLAFACGLRRARVASCAKHFPGHGDTSADSHLELPLVGHSLQLLRKRELVPFARAARARLPFMMMAHLMLPALDGRLPTSLSPNAYGLARRLGFRGLLLTDDLEMAAISSRYGVEEACWLALRAGAEGLLICHRPQAADRAIEQITRRAEKSAALRERLQQIELRWRRFLRLYRADELHPDGKKLKAVLASPLRRRLDKTLTRLVDNS